MQKKENLPGLSAVVLSALIALVPGVAAADAETILFDLVMAQESVLICGFPMSEADADRVEVEISAYQEELGRGEADLAELREQAAWQVLRQKAVMCDSGGSWRRRYDEVLVSLGAE